MKQSINYFMRDILTSSNVRLSKLDSLRMQDDFGVWATFHFKSQQRNWPGQVPSTDPFSSSQFFLPASSRSHRRVGKNEPKCNIRILNYELSAYSNFKLRRSLAEQKVTTGRFFFCFLTSYRRIM